MALAAIQQLKRLNEEKDAQLTELRDRNAALEARLAALEQIVRAPRSSAPSDG